jgi:hypothetical protein
VTGDRLERADLVGRALTQVLGCSSCEQALMARSKEVFPLGVEFALLADEPGFGGFLRDGAEAFVDAAACISLIDCPGAIWQELDATGSGSHGASFFVRWVTRPGRPCAALYASHHASRSSRSKPTPCPPIGISIRCGRTSRSKRLRSMPR